MQAIFLAAGAGTRLRPLTLETPKPMIKIKNKPLIQYNLEKLPSEISEIIIVVNYLKEQIQNYFGDQFQGKPIKYVEQKEMLGTGHAVKICEDLIKGKFLVLMGDDIYEKEDMEECIKHNNCVLAKEYEGEFTGGKIVLNERGNLEAIKEGNHFGRILACAAMYVLDKRFFDYEFVKLEGRNEYGLPQVIVEMSKDMPVAIVKTKGWIQINNLEQLDIARKILE